jgi:hypothetical protein
MQSASSSALGRTGQLTGTSLPLRRIMSRNHTASTRPRLISNGCRRMMLREGYLCRLTAFMLPLDCGKVMLPEKA